MFNLYFPIGTTAFVTLECGHHDARHVCGTYDQYSRLFCPPCNNYQRLNTIVVVTMGPEQGKDDIPHRLPEIA
jgi:hypothetical protein